MLSYTKAVIKMKYLSKEEFSLKMKKIKQKNEQIKLRNELKAERRKLRRFNLKKIKTSNKVLASAIVAIIGYTAASLYIQYQTSVEVSSTLTTLWFSFWTVEIVVLAGIKVSKVFKGDSSSDDDTAC